MKRILLTLTMVCLFVFSACGPCLALNKIIFPIGYYPDPTRGRPIALGELYIGEPDTDPTVVGNQKQVSIRQETGVFVDIPQPISLNSAGEPVYNSTPVQLFIDSTYSMTVLDSLGSQVYNFDDATGGEGEESDQLPTATEGQYAQKGASVWEAVDDTLPTGTERQVLQKGSADWGAVDKDVLYVTDYGATGNGSTDDTAFIQLAIDAAEASSGSIVAFPAGTYKVTATLTIDSSDVFLKGESMESVIIKRSSNFTGNTIEFVGDNATKINDVGISDITIQATTEIDNNAHIYFDATTQIRVKNINILHGYIGMKFLASNNVFVDTVYMVFDRTVDGTASLGMVFADSTSYTANPDCGNVFVSNFNIRGVASIDGSTESMIDGLRIESGDGLWFSNGHIGNTRYSDLQIVTSVASGEPVSLVMFDNVIFDQTMGMAVRFTGSSAIMRNIQFSNCHLTGTATSTHGVHVNDGAVVRNVQFTGCVIKGHGQQGVYIDSTSAYNFAFTGCQVRGNSATSSGAVAGYYINKGSAYQITGGTAGGHATTAAAGPQKYGIQIGANGNSVTISGVDVRKNDTPSISFNIHPTSISGVIIKGCYIDTSCTLASDTSLTLPPGSDFYQITLDTTPITSISNSFVGHTVVLQVETGVTISDGGDLYLDSDFTSAGSFNTITLVSLGTSWLEVSRSAN